VQPAHLLTIAVASKKLSIDQSKTRRVELKEKTSKARILTQIAAKVYSERWSFRLSKSPDMKLLVMMMYLEYPTSFS
jgi:hypothetical protein